MNPTSQLTQIGKYKILSELGRGGMGVVYRAEDQFIGREVAIKTLADATPEMRQRFAIEARSGVLNHPNIVTIYDFGEHEGNPYIVMEFLHGQTLERMIKEQHPLSMTDKLEIIRQVCEGLGYAHSRGVIHRDIKPANVIMLPNGSAKLVDFGIAQLESLSGHTVAGSVIGTYQYLSPERLKGEVSDSRADIWSAGVLLYLLLTGSLPFPGEDISALHRVITDPFPPLSSLLSVAYPESLDNIVNRSLAKDPAQRYPTALEMAVDLEATRDAIRLSRVEDLLTQARSLIDRNELLRARPLLLDLQRLAPQNTAVRNLLREVGERLTQQPDSRLPAPNSGMTLQPGQATAPSSQEGASTSEEERRSRIIDQIVTEIRAQADRGHESHALDLVQRSLQRAPGNPALLALQAELQARLEPAHPVATSLQDTPEPAEIPRPAAAQTPSVELAQTESAPAEPEFVEPEATPTVAVEPAVLELAILEPAIAEPEITRPEMVRLAPAPPANESVPDTAEPAFEVSAGDNEALATVAPEPEHSFPTTPTPHAVAAPPQAATSKTLSGDLLTAPSPALPQPLEADLKPEDEASPDFARTPPTPAQLPQSHPLTPAPGSEAPEAAAHSEVPAISLTTPPLADPLPASTPASLNGSAAPLTTPPSPARPNPGKAAAPKLTHAAPATRPLPPIAAEPRPQPTQTGQTTRPTTSHSRAYLLAAAALVLLVVFAALLLHHRPTPAAAQPDSFVQLVATPYAQVLRVTTEDGQAVALPAGEHTTPLRLDHVSPGTYTVSFQQLGGATAEARCTITSDQHLCSVSAVPLSDADLQAILTGGGQQ